MTDYTNHQIVLLRAFVLAHTEAGNTRAARFYVRETLAEQARIARRAGDDSAALRIERRISEV